MGGRRERGELVEVRRLEVGDAVHQRAIGGDGRVQLTCRIRSRHLILVLLVEYQRILSSHPAGVTGIREESLMDEQARAAVQGWQQTVNAAWEQTQTGLAQGPPSHEELLRRYQVDDDKRGLVNAFVVVGPTVTADERDRLHGLLPWEQVRYFAATAESTLGGQTVFPDVGREGTGDNHRDAFRHAYWNSLLVQTVGFDNTVTLTTVHEGTPDEEPIAHVREAMDLYNNEVGRQIAQEHPDAGAYDLSALVQQAVRDGRMVVIDENGRLVPSDYDFRPR